MSTSSASTPTKIVALVSRKKPPTVFIRVARKPRLESCESSPFASSDCTTATTSFTTSTPEASRRQSQSCGDHSPDFFRQRIGGSQPVNAMPALWLFVRQSVVALPHSRMKRQRLVFKPIPPCLLRMLARQADFDRQVQKKRHIWLQTGGGEGYHRRQRLHIKPPASTLVHQRRIGETIAH